MLHRVPGDFLHVAGELLTGKSVAVLLGITRLALDRRLACAALLLGALSGASFSVWSLHATSALGASGVALGNRLLQLGFSLFLSLSLLVSLSQGVIDEGGRGVALAIVPAYCIVAQDLPQRASSALVAFLLSLAFHLTALSTALPKPVARPAPERLDPGPARGDWATLGSTLQLAALAFYGSVYHGPTQVLFGTREGHRHAAYCSPLLDCRLGYRCFIFFTATWLRACVWLHACFLQDNPMHLLFEGDRSRPWDWACCYLLMTALLYQACWTATQLREQVLPYFQATDPGARLKLLALVLGLAALHRHGAHWAVFCTADALACLCVLAAVRTLRRGRTHAKR